MKVLFQRRAEGEAFPVSKRQRHCCQFTMRFHVPFGSRWPVEVHGSHFNLHRIAGRISRFVGCHRHLHPVWHKFLYLKAGAPNPLLGDAENRDIAASLRVSRNLNAHVKRTTI